MESIRLQTKTELYSNVTEFMTAVAEMERVHWSVRQVVPIIRHAEYTVPNYIVIYERDL